MADNKQRIHIRENHSQTPGLKILSSVKYKIEFLTK